MFAKFGSALVGLMFVVQAQAGSIVALGVQDALLGSNAAAAFRDELKKQTAGAEAQVISLEKQARDLQADLEKNQGLLSAEDAKQKQLQFQKVYAEYQRQRQQLQQTRAQQEQRFVAEMRPKLDEVIRGLIEEGDISLILNRQSVIYMENDIDITGVVVERLNAQ